MRVVLGKDDLDHRLPARQGRLLFAYLVLNRRRAVAREELIDLLWPQERPLNAEASLSVVLSRLRRALGEGVLEGRSQLSLSLPPSVRVDVEVATAAAEAARTAAGGADWKALATDARVAADILKRGFLVGHEGSWIDDVRAHFDELLLRALQYAAVAGLALGGEDFVLAERSARELIAVAPFREEGYRLLMEAHAAQDNVAEALLVYELVRCLLRDELGTTPGGGLKELHRQLVREADLSSVERPATRRFARAAKADAPTGAAAR
jgi:DNA-binding SARP family transcriptional activator